MPRKRWDPKTPDRIDPWPVWLRAMQEYTTEAERNLLMCLTTLPDAYKDILRDILGYEQYRLHCPPWER